MSQKSIDSFNKRLSQLSDNEIEQRLEKYDPKNYCSELNKTSIKMKKIIKTAEEILEPYVETPFRHTKVVEKDNALLAMAQFGDQFRLPEGMGWIDINDQKPEDYKRVLYFDSRDGHMSVGYFVWSQTPVDYVTHWMELPAKPIKN